MIIISALISFVISFVLGALVFRGLVKSFDGIKAFRDCSREDSWSLSAFVNLENSYEYRDDTRERLKKCMHIGINDYCQEIALLLSFIVYSIILAFCFSSIVIIVPMFAGIVAAFSLSLKMIHSSTSGWSRRLTNLLDAKRASVNTLFLIRTLVRIVIFLAMIAVFVFLFWYLSNR